MVQPDLGGMRMLAASGEYRRIPVSRELYADRKTPIEVLMTLREAGKHCFLLESAENGQRWGRYTFLGFDPALELSCTGGLLRVREGEDLRMVTEERCAHPGEAIRRILKENKSPRVPGLPPFTGGFVGYFSYDYVKYSEPCLKLDAKDEEGFKDVDLMLFDKVVAFDHFRQKIVLIVNAKTDHLEAGHREAVQSLDCLADLILRGPSGEPQPGILKSPLRPLFGEAEYCALVEKAKAAIREGEIFQAVLSNRLEAEFEGSLLNAYRVLRAENPSPYMFYFSSDDLELAGASPETLVRLEDGVLHTFPLAGTRPRGKNEEEDRMMEKELLRDEKELSEHNMLVDLGRNDLGKISKFGSVHVEGYHEILRFSHVMHIGSTVAGELVEGKDAVDAIDAVLPAGTLSGAPKIRACALINELENNKRGVYGGAVGYLDFTGNLDTCIAIRLAFKKNGKVFVRSGAGIVADSVPENEYRECLQKAKAVTDALLAGEEALDG